MNLNAALAGGGGLLTAGGLLVGILIGAGGENQADIIPGGEGETETVVVAPSTGLGFDALKFCEEATIVLGHEDNHIGGIRYIAQRAATFEQIDWPDAPAGQNPFATHYWYEAGAQKSEPVEITKPAADCLKRRAQ